MSRSRLQQSWTVLCFLNLLCLLPLQAVSSSSSRRYSNPARTLPSSPVQLNIPSKSLYLLRGGSTKTPPPLPPPDNNNSDNKHDKYRMEQILLLQSRSARLREALIDRGLLKDYDKLDAPTTPQPVDWDCAFATEKYPKRCLYSFDAEPNTKVVAPIGTTEWISLSALNQLRRTDPSKVEPMWHNKYAIFSSWFKQAGKSPYSMYAHLPAQGYLLSLLLDVPLVLNLAVLATISFVLVLTRPIWETMLTVLLTSQFLWMRWPNWGRFVHAALPLKLMLGQMAWKGVTMVFGKLQKIMREYLVQVESRIWEESIPLTILEGQKDDITTCEEGDDDDEMEYK